MLVSWRGPACLAEAIPQPAHPIGCAEARPQGRAFIRARRMAARSPFPRRSLRSLPPSPSRPFGAQQEKRIPERGKGALYRQPLRCACGRRNQRLCAAIAARSHGALRPHAPGSRLRAGGRAVGAHRPTQPGSAGNRTSAQACAARRALPAPPPWFVHRAPRNRPGPACGRFRGARRWPIKQPAPLRLPWPARAPRLAPSLVALGQPLRPSPAASSARVWRHGSLRHSSPGPRASRFCCIFPRYSLQTFVRCGTIFVRPPQGVVFELWPFGAIILRCCPWNAPSCCLARIAVARPKSSTCKWPMVLRCMPFAAIAAPAARAS